MNYFKLLYERVLLEALWDTFETYQNLGIDYPSEPSFISNLVDYYELYYKYFELTHRPFEGHPTRKENIEKQVKSRLQNSMMQIRGVLLEVFEQWLAAHAITKPKQWAIARLKGDVEGTGHSGFDDMPDDEIGTIISNLMYEYHKYQYPNMLQKESQVKSDFWRDVVRSSKKLPTFQKVIVPKLIEIERERRQNDMTDDPEEYRRMYRLGPRVDLENHAYNVKAKDIDVSEMLDVYFPEPENLIQLIGHYNLPEVLQELYEKLVFPAWYSKWSAEGIDNTRKRIMTAHANLKKTSDVSDVNKFSADLNIALNAAHQTGPMIDYVSDYLEKHDQPVPHEGMREFLTTLSDIPPEIMERWNDELKEIGVKL